jgi:streptogramin lyase
MTRKQKCASAALAVVVLSGALAMNLRAQSQPSQQAPVNDLPNPYDTISNWGQLPEGRHMGSSAAIDIDRDGKSVWVAERCGANTCEGSDLNMVLKFDASGKLLKQFGAGLLVTPHGIYVDKEDNLWITDMGLSKDKTRGEQVFKFSPAGKVLLTLGKAGVAGSGPDTFFQPCDVIVGPDGDIYVSDSHTADPNGSNGNPPSNARISKFTKDGKFIKSWGMPGSEPGQLHIPHSMAFDSQGRLFVADRGNNRIQIFDQEGKSLAIWTQFSRPSGMFIRSDVLYISDSETNNTNHPGGWKRGIRVGSAKDGTVKYFIPQEPEPSPDAIPSGMEGIAADAQGNIYGSNVYLPGFMPGFPPGEIKKFVTKKP